MDIKWRRPSRSHFQSTFSRVLLGVTIASFIAVVVAELINYRQITQSFQRFTNKEVIILERVGGELRIERDNLPGDYQKFVNQYQSEVKNNLLISSAVGFLLAMITGAIISRQITQPLKKLKQTISRVTESAYSIRAKESGSKEMREVIASFNQLIDELEQQETLRQELMANMAHELKTPITKMRGQVEGVIDGVYTDAEKTMPKVLKNIAQLEYLIEALYEVNQLNPQDVSLHKTKCNILDIVETSISGINDKPVKFEINIDKKLTKKADPNRLQQIIDNLVTNAYKYTHQGEIIISADKREFYIKDTGVGIAGNHLPHIFDRFYRVDKSRNRTSGGLGLGLYIVKRLVTLHGWEIKARSALGKGTSFTIIW